MRRLADFRYGRIARPETLTLAFVLAVGAVVRALMMLVEPGILSPDSNSFLISAEATLAGDPLTHDPFKTPLYSLYLAAFMRLGANQTSGTLLIASQHVLGLMTTAIFFGIALRLFSLWVAAVSSLMLTTHALLLFYETSILSETLFVFLLALLVDQTIRFVLDPVPLWRFAALGALAGLTTLTRPVAQWFIVIIAAVVMTSERASGRWLRAASLALGVYVVTLLPWMYVNKQSFGFWGVSLGQGLGLFMRVFDVDKQTPIQGTAYPAVERAIAATNRGNAYAVRNELNFRLGFSASGSDEQMLGYALANVRAHPLSYVWHSARNWMEQLLIEQEDIEVCRSREGPYLCNSRSTDMSTSMFPNVPPPGHRRLKRRLAAWFTQWYVRMWMVVPLALVGMIYYVVRRSSNTRMPGIVLIAAVLYFSGVPALINWPEERFRLPIDPLIFIFACVGVRALSHVRATPAVTLTSLPKSQQEEGEGRISGYWLSVTVAALRTWLSASKGSTAPVSERSPHAPAHSDERRTRSRGC